MTSALGRRTRLRRRPGLQGVRLEFALLVARLVDGLEKGHCAAALPLVLECRLADARTEIAEV